MKNTITIVTGAASGIGRATALEAARRGSRVIATDLNQKGLSETASLWQGIETASLDVADSAAITAFAEKIIPTLGGKKLVLVNNAGVGLASGPFAETSLEDFEWLLSINLWGVIRMTKAFLPYMLQHDTGHVVNISSVFGLGGVAHQSAYCTAKFGVRGFTETLRMELMSSGVKTTVVHPGGVRTNIAAGARIGGKQTPEIRDKQAFVFQKTSPTSPESAANQILDAVKNGKARLVIGFDGKLIDFFARLMPTGYTGILKGQIEKAFGVKL